MLKLAFLALTLLPGTVAVPVVNVEHLFIFQFDGWAFECRATLDTLSDCAAQKNLGDNRVRLEEGDGVVVSVDGGCPAAGAATADVVEEVPRGQRWSVDPLQVKSVASDRVNARRAACGHPRLSEDEAETLKAASILFIEISN